MKALMKVASEFSDANHPKALEFLNKRMSHHSKRLHGKSIDRLSEREYGEALHHSKLELASKLPHHKVSVNFR